MMHGATSHDITSAWQESHADVLFEPQSSKISVLDASPLGLCYHAITILVSEDTQRSSLNMPHGSESKIMASQLLYKLHEGRAYSSTLC